MNEIWRDIKDYEGLYQVSSEGRIKSLNYRKTGKGKILKNCKAGKGYLKVDLYKEGKSKTIQVHRLVAQAFLNNPNNLSQINHRNEDKTDNRVENIEYCNSKYNINYGTRTEKMQKPVLQFSKTGEFINKWSSATQAEKELGFSQSNIIKCCKGKKKSIGGFKWFYHYKSIWLKKHIPQIKLKNVA